MTGVKEFIPVPMYKGIPNRKLRNIYLAVIAEGAKKATTASKKEIENLNNVKNDFNPEQLNSSHQGISSEVKRYGNKQFRAPIYFDSKTLPVNLYSTRHSPPVSVNIKSRLGLNKNSDEKIAYKGKKGSLLTEYLRRIKCCLNSYYEATDNGVQEQEKLNNLFDERGKRQTKNETPDISMFKKDEERKKKMVDRSLSDNRISIKNFDCIDYCHDNNCMQSKKMKQHLVKLGSCCTENELIEHGDITTAQERDKNKYSKLEKKCTNTYLSDSDKGTNEFERQVNTSGPEKNLNKSAQEVSDMRDDIPLIFTRMRRILQSVKEEIHSDSLVNESTLDTVSFRKENPKNVEEYYKTYHHDGQKNEISESQTQNWILKNEPEKNEVLSESSRNISRRNNQIINKHKNSQHINTKSDVEFRKLQEILRSGEDEQVPSFKKIWKSHSDSEVFSYIKPLDDELEFQFMNKSFVTSENFTEKLPLPKKIDEAYFQPFRRRKSKTNSRLINSLGLKKTKKENIDITEKTKKRMSLTNLSPNKEKTSDKNLEEYTKEKLKDYHGQGPFTQKNSQTLHCNAITFSGESGYQKSKSGHENNKYCKTSKKRQKQKFMAQLNTRNNFENYLQTIWGKNAGAVSKNILNLRSHNVKRKTGKINFLLSKNQKEDEGFDIDLEKEPHNSYSRSQIIPPKNSNWNPEGNNNYLFSERGAEAKHHKQNNKNFDDGTKNKLKFFSQLSKDTEVLKKKKSPVEEMIIHKNSDKNNPDSDLLSQFRKRMKKRGDNRGTEGFRNINRKKTNSYGIYETLENYTHPKKDKIPSKNYPTFNRNNIIVHPIHANKNKKPTNSSASEWMAKRAEEIDKSDLVQDEYAPKIGQDKLMFGSQQQKKLNRLRGGNFVDLNYDRHVPVSKVKSISDIYFASKNKTNGGLNSKIPQSINLDRKLNSLSNKKVRNVAAKYQMSNSLLEENKTPLVIHDDEKLLGLGDKLMKNEIILRHRVKKGCSSNSIKVKESSSFGDFLHFQDLRWGQKMAKNDHWHRFLKKPSRISLLSHNSSDSFPTKNFTRMYRNELKNLLFYRNKNNALTELKSNIDDKNNNKKVHNSPPNNMNTKHSNYHLQMQKKAPHFKYLEQTTKDIFPSENMDSNKEKSKNDQIRAKNLELSDFFPLKSVPFRIKLPLKNNANKHVTHGELFSKKTFSSINWINEKEMHSLAAQNYFKTKQFDWQKRMLHRDKFNSNQNSHSSVKINKNKTSKFNFHKNDKLARKYYNFKQKNSQKKNTEAHNYAFICARKHSSERMFDVNLAQDNRESKFKTSSNKQDDKLIEIIMLKTTVPNMPRPEEVLLEKRKSKNDTIIKNDNYDLFLKYKLAEEVKYLKKNRSFEAMKNEEKKMLNENYETKLSKSGNRLVKTMFLFNTIQNLFD